MFQLAQAQANNVSMGNDATSLLALINPLQAAQQLLTSYPARDVIPNQPAGKLSDACYNDLMTSFDSLVAMKKWAIDCKSFINIFQNQF